MFRLAGLQPRATPTSSDQMLQSSSLQARRPSAGPAPCGIGVASRLFPTSYVVPSVTAVAPRSAPVRARGSAVGDASRTVQASRPATLTQSQSASAFARLYAHAVDLMGHKDDVFRHFGLRRDGSRRPPSAPCPPTNVRGSAASQQSRSFDPHRRSSTTSATPRSKMRPGSHSRVYERSSSAACLPSRRAASASASTPVMARSYSLQSTLASRSAVSPRRRQPSTRSAARPSGKPRSSRLSPSSKSKTTTTSTTKAKPTDRQPASKRRPSEHEPKPGPTKQQLRRQSSYPALSTSVPASKSQPAVKSQRKASVVGGRQSTAAPVMVEVSRRTSAPIVATGEPGVLRRRPSVARIPSASGQASGSFRTEETTLAGGQSLGPRGSIVGRRDARVERLMEQVSVLKASLGLSDEDLQWKVESSRGNAFLAAERRLGECEERYDRLAFEVAQLAATPAEEVGTALLRLLRQLEHQAAAVAEAKPALAACQTALAQSRRGLLDARVQLEVQRAAPDLTEVSTDASTADEAVETQAARVEEASAELLAAQERLQRELERLNTLLLDLTGETDALAQACSAFRFLSPAAATASDTLVALLRAVPESSSGGERLLTLCGQAVQATQRLRGSRAADLRAKQAELERTAQDLDVWKARREAAAEFAAEMAARERQWQATHADDNEACVRLLRALMPPGVQTLSVDAIVAEAAQCGVLFTHELAAYLKHQRLLHWLATHARDIARDNFLAVESAAWFVNFAALDVVELRAVVSVLPAAFELDKDGKKAAWRSQLLEHVYGAVKQQRGERVKAGWDPVARTRAEVPLKPLTERQMLNPVYRYPTDAELQARTDKYELQLRRLRLKREQLQQLEAQIPAAKAEYAAITEDARAEDLQRAFGRATINKLRDDAKQALTTLTKARDALQTELRRAEAAWAALTPTYEQFQRETELIRQLDPETRAARIRGPFPADTELQPRQRAAFKKMSVEEEAQARKQELESAIAQRGQDIAEADAASDPAPVARPVVAVAEVNSSLETAAKTESSMVETAAVEIPGDEKPGDEKPVMETPVVAAPNAPRKLRVATNVLRFLEHDFCSPKRIKALSTSASPSPCVSATAKATEGGGTEGTSTRRPTPKLQVDEVVAPPPTPVFPPPLTRPKSKTLLLLMEKEEAAKNASIEAVKDVDSEVAAAPKAAGGPANFLAELQRRANAKAKPADAVAVETPPVCQSQPPVNFLDELKRKAAAKTTPKAVASVPEQPKPGPPATPVSFLDELKARANRSAVH